jgi:hypothetical protein
MKAERVFDLLNCGSRNRFTIVTPHGPVVVHNCVQATARDILFNAIPVAEARGYQCVLRIHDEIICECPDTDEFTPEGLSTILSTPPKWLPNMPLAAAGFQTKVYRKE